MTTIAYNIIQPPFTLKFREMSKKELQNYYHWFREVIPERINELTSAVRTSNSFEDWEPDYNPSSLNLLGKWFATQVQMRSRSQDEIDEITAKFPFPRSDRELTDRTISLAMDISMYLSQTLLRNNPLLDWDQPFGSKKFIDYGQPVLVGFMHGIPVNPVGVVTTLAYGLIRKTKTGMGLREMYDKLNKQARGEE
jgi:hypothetical protein